MHGAGLAFRDSEFSPPCSLARKTVAGITVTGASVLAHYPSLGIVRVGHRSRFPGPTLVKIRGSRPGGDSVRLRY